MAAMNKYEILNVVGEGVYGYVLRCRNKDSGEVVAIKKFKENEADNEAVRRTTLRELQTLRMLRHPNIVALYDAFRRKGKLYLVFEFMERNLLQVMEEHPSGLPASRVLLYASQMLAALAYCHGRGVVHRDVKPENLLVAADGGALKLCDFGFARVLNSEANAQYTEYVATRWYRAPELLVGLPYECPVDVWAAGCILGELSDGQPLFPGESDIDQLYTIQRLLGPLTPDQLAMFYRNQRYRGLKFPDMSKPLTLRARYQGVLAGNTLDLLAHMLVMDASSRWTAEQCLQHPVFAAAPAKVRRAVSSARALSSARGSRGTGTTASVHSTTSSNSNNSHATSLPPPRTAHGNREPVLPLAHAPAGPPPPPPPPPPPVMAPQPAAQTPLPPVPPILLVAAVAAAAPVVVIPTVVDAPCGSAASSRPASADEVAPPPALPALPAASPLPQISALPAADEPALRPPSQPQLPVFLDHPFPRRGSARERSLAPPPPPATMLSLSQPLALPLAAIQAGAGNGGIMADCGPPPRTPEPRLPLNRLIKLSSDPHARFSSNPAPSPKAERRAAPDPAAASGATQPAPAAALAATIPGPGPRRLRDLLEPRRSGGGGGGGGGGGSGSTGAATAAYTGGGGPARPAAGRADLLLQRHHYVTSPVPPALTAASPAVTPSPPLQPPRPKSRQRSARGAPSG